MPGWTLVDTHPTQGRTYQRPLGMSEHGLFQEALFNGTTDMLRSLELRLSNGARDAHLFSNANIVRAWKSTKRRFPLAGATVVRRGIDSSSAGGNGDDGATRVNWKPHFVVRECDLSVIGPREIVFGQVVDSAEAQQQAETILNGPRPLSDDLLVQLYVFRETNSETARADVLHMMLLIAHCVADGMASRTLVGCFLDTLGRGSGRESEPAQMPLEDRLAMAIPIEELEPVHLRMLSPSRQRWRKAVATVILKMRLAKRQGGHTIPCRRTRLTPYIAACSGLIEISLTQAQTTDVIAKCRQHKFTFGNAYLVFAQMAMTRVLYRRFLRGEISEEEWSYRKRHPHINLGVMNVRPYLDKVWFEGGGRGDFLCSLSVYAYQLPFMTLGRTDRVHDGTKHTFLDGAPPFSDLLTFDRLLHRAALVKKQAMAFSKHPLFFEIVHALLHHLLEHKLLFTQRMKNVVTGDRNGHDEDEPLAVADISVVVAHSGSSLGNMDPIFPLEYPLPDTHPLSPYSSIPHPSRAGYVANLPSATLAPKADITLCPTIAVEYERSHLHVRPGGIYLGALTLGGRLKMYTYYDRNVFEEEVVREWVDELKEAVLWFVDELRNCQL